MSFTAENWLSHFDMEWQKRTENSIFTVLKKKYLFWKTPSLPLQGQKWKKTWNVLWYFTLNRKRTSRLPLPNKVKGKKSYWIPRRIFHYHKCKQKDILLSFYSSVLRYFKQINNIDNFHMTFMNLNNFRYCIAIIFK